VRNKLIGWEKKFVSLVEDHNVVIYKGNRLITVIYNLECVLILIISVKTQFGFFNRKNVKYILDYKIQKDVKWSIWRACGML